MTPVVLEVAVRSCVCVDRDPDLFGLVTSPGSGTQVRVQKEEFRGILNRMGFIMEDDEFDKLWRK